MRKQIINIVADSYYLDRTKSVAIVSPSFQKLKTGPIRELRDILGSSNLAQDFTENKTHSWFENKGTGSRIYFFSHSQEVVWLRGKVLHSIFLM